MVSTAPHGPSQQAVIRQALKNAGVTPNQISYVEAHGTGTPLGDPIEVQSLWEVLREGRNPEDLCAIGSVKTNIGHLEAAAGIAGLIKTALCLEHRRIPAHLHLRSVNRHLELEQMALRIPVVLEEWSPPTGSRFAGVSSFGFGGTNAHVVLEQAGGAPTLSGQRAANALSTFLRCRRRVRPACANSAIGMLTTSKLTRKSRSNRSALPPMRDVRTLERDGREPEPTLETLLRACEPPHPNRCGPTQTAQVAIPEPAEDRAPVHRAGLAVQRHGTRTVPHSARIPQSSRCLRRHSPE